MTARAPSLASLIDRFADRHIIVIGDLILDHYLRGSVHRTSPEAPVPVLAVESEEFVLGGAGNVAANIHALGAKVTLLSVVGEDGPARLLHRLHPSTGHFKMELIEEPRRPTTVKTRCVSQGQQMLRYDRETTEPIEVKTQREALKRYRAALRKAEAVIISDYGKGFLPPPFIAEIIALARDKKRPVIVDPKGRDYVRYRGATTLTPNQKEASEASGILITSEESLGEAARRLQKLVAGDAVVITRGPQGVSVFPKRGSAVHLPARAREVFDVTGAGDTFIATLTLALASGGSLPQAAELANAAGGVVVAMEGVVTIHPEQLRSALGGDALPPRKVLGLAELTAEVKRLRQQGRRLVFTNGFFDLLHHGHLRLLEKARALGDCLIVAINSDESTRRQKGKPRPILAAAERSQLLAALPFVDYVVIFEEDTPETLLRTLRPDILAKGAPGGRKPVVIGRAIVEAYGGSIAYLDVGSTANVGEILDRALAGKKL